MKLSLSLAAAMLALLAGFASAHDFKIGPLKIGHPWSRATPAGAKVGGGYLTVENTGTTPDRLVSISVPFAARAEMHEMAAKDGIVTMRPLENGIEVPAGGKVEFKPGGYHIMFMELKQPLKQGEMMKGSLTFEKAGTVDVEFKVDSIAAKGGESEHKGH